MDIPSDDRVSGGSIVYWGNVSVLHSAGNTLHVCFIFSVLSVVKNIPVTWCSARHMFKTQRTTETNVMSQSCIYENISWEIFNCLSLIPWKHQTIWSRLDDIICDGLLTNTFWSELHSAATVSTKAAPRNSGKKCFMKLYYSSDLSLKRWQHNSTVNILWKSMMQPLWTALLNYLILVLSGCQRFWEIITDSCLETFLSLPLPFRYVLWVISLMFGVHLLLSFRLSNTILLLQKYPFYV